ncbi:hypothetical protein WISP_23251 [Willisornis vidua]|uniref:Uncharacterized protein n=1 Tax=Willisornis vidua TaxID=1566151 RepID=A0ABQ9DN87_9PASS|nr:hypothetical protein WISP_23251 [Willisornis vidua]
MWEISWRHGEPDCIVMAQLQQGGPDEKEKTTALKDLLSRIDLDELMKKDEPPLEFPDTLEGFEYIFNETPLFDLYVNLGSLLDMLELPTCLEQLCPARALLPGVEEACFLPTHSCKSRDMNPVDFERRW